MFAKGKYFGKNFLTLLDKKYREFVFFYFLNPVGYVCEISGEWNF